MKHVYITGTFRNEWNKEFNIRLATALEKRNITLYLPQRDSEQLGNRKQTFLQDIKGMDMCQMILAIATKTQTSNWGFELGYVYKEGKPIIIITDEEHPVDLLAEGAASYIKILKNIDDIDSYIDEITNKIKELLHI